MAKNTEKGIRVKKANDGKIVTHEQEKKPFKGVRKEALEKLGPTLNRLSKYDKE